MRREANVAKKLKEHEEMEKRRREKIAERILKTNEARETMMLELEKEVGEDTATFRKEREPSPKLEAPPDFIPQMKPKTEKRPEAAVAKSVDITSGTGLLQNKLASIVDNPYATGQASTRVVNENKDVKVASQLRGQATMIDVNNKS